jgi:hypothetical protein
MEDQTTKTPEEANTAESVISMEFGKLSQNNPGAHKILCKLNQEGFFEKSQTKISVKQVANQLLATIQSRGAEDENRIA